MYSPGTVGVPYNAQQQVPPTPWTTKLCNCTGNCNNCCLTCCCTAIAFGQIVEIIDTGSTTCWCNGLVYTLLCCCTPCYSYSYRTKLRAKFNLVEEPCGDCLVHFFCERCAVCQEYRELKNRGLDPALGWAVNMEKNMRATHSGIPRTEKNMRATHSGIPRTVPPMGQGMWQ